MIAATTMTSPSFPSHSNSTPTTTTSRHEIPSSSRLEIPEAFLCPINMTIMIAPVMTKAGLSFDKTAILEWLVNHGNTCPLTRQPLNASNLVTNHALRIRIEHWCKANGYDHEQQPSTDTNKNRSCDDSNDGICLVTCLSSAMMERSKKTKKSSRSTTTVAQEAPTASSSRNRTRRASILSILQSADIFLTSSR